MRRIASDGFVIVSVRRSSTSSASAGAAGCKCTSGSIAAAAAVATRTPFGFLLDAVIVDTSAEAAGKFHMRTPRSVGPVLLATRQAGVRAASFQAASS